MIGIDEKMYDPDSSPHSRQDLQETAGIFAQMLLRGDSPSDAMDAWTDTVTKLYNESEDPDMREESRVWGGVHRWCAWWFLSGLPTIVPAHRLAASMMATNIPVEFAAALRPPWNAFLITVPPGVLERDECMVAVHMSKELESLGHHTRYPQWNPGTNFEALLFSRTRGICQRLVGDFHELANWSQELQVGAILAAERGAMAYHERWVKLLARVVIGVCCEFDNRAAVIRSSKKRALEQMQREKVPQCWNTQLTRAVSVDCREHVRSFLAGTRSGLSVQSMVAGHWKNQRHGPGGIDRKFIHIEPYWRGPESAPIAVRSHILNERNTPNEQ